MILPELCPTLRGKYSNMHFPELCAPMMKFEGIVMSGTLVLVVMVTGVERGLGMVMT